MSTKPHAFDGELFSLIRRKIKSLMILIKLGIEPAQSLRGGGVMRPCKGCGAFVGGDIHVTKSGVSPLVGKCHCGRRCRINVAREYGLDVVIGGDS